MARGCRLNKSSAVAEMGDRLATIDMGRNVGASVPLSVGSQQLPTFRPMSIIYVYVGFWTTTLSSTVSEILSLLYARDSEKSFSIEQHVTSGQSNLT